MLSKKVFITGANRGIGKGILEYYLKQNYNPENLYVGVRDINKSSWDLQNQGIDLPKHNFFYLDLEKNKSIDSLHHKIASREIKVNIHILRKKKSPLITEVRCAGQQRGDQPEPANRELADRRTKRRRKVVLHFEQTANSQRADFGGSSGQL